MPIVEAKQWDGSQESANLIAQWSKCEASVTEKLLRFVSWDGVLYANANDWFVLRDDGRIYLCTQDIYQQLRAADSKE